MALELSRNITFGQYLNLGSPLHRLDPRTKLVGVAILMTAVMVCRTPGGLAIGLLAAAIIQVAGHIPLGYTLRGLRVLIITMLFLFLFQALFYQAPPEATIWRWWLLSFSWPGVLYATLMIVRVVLLYQLTTTLMFTTTLYYAAGGPAAHPLVLIHGLGDEADTWRHVIRPLAESYRVIALDLPGFGRSGHPRRAYTLTFFARTVAQLLRALDVPRATLVGSSLGAAVAQRLALGRPDLVERLVLSDGALPVEAGLPPAALWWFLTPGIGELAYTSLRRSQDGAYATLRPYYGDLDALPAADRAFLRERVWARVWSDDQRRAFLSTLRWLAIERVFRARQLRTRLVGLATPTLLIWGEHDHIIARAEGEAIAALLPDAHLEVIPAAGHLPHQERPHDFVAALRSVLRVQ